MIASVASSAPVLRLLPYLMRFAGLPAGVPDWGAVVDSLRRLASTYGLDPDRPALELVDELGGYASLPRCGVPDVLPVVEGARCQWPHRDITVAVLVGDLGGIPAATVREVFRKALDSWEAVCGLRFTLTDDPGANIVARAADLGGKGGTLADSYLPCGASASDTMRQRYDTREPWSSYGLEYLQGTIAHEVGHAIGLSHSRRGNLMQPFAERGLFVPQKGDVDEVLERYGPARPGTPPTTPAPVPDPSPAARFNLGRVTLSGPVPAGTYEVILRRVP